METVLPNTPVTFLWPDGAGGAVHDGLVVLPGAVPGDVVSWAETGRRGKVRQGEVQEVVTPSEHRADPPCPHHKECGGCDLAHVDAQARRGFLGEAVSRRLNQEVTVVPSPRQTAHRARIDLNIDGGRFGYRRAGSQELLEIETCHVARPEVQAAMEVLREADLSRVDRVEIRSDGERAVYAFQGKRAPDLGDVACNGRRVYGDPNLILNVAGLPLRASPNSFYQVNIEVNELLVDHVVTQVTAAAPTRVLDMFCGIGNLSLPMARKTQVVGVDSDGQATSDLRFNAETSGLDVKVVSMKAERFDPSREFFDVVVLDPPRIGTRGLLKRICVNRPTTIIYVSCNLQSALRDLRDLPKDYKLAHAQCFEMFPDTHHLETVLVYRR
jgi:23S rRNA (uracil1939-C5)-methyltransferase